MTLSQTFRSIIIEDLTSIYNNLIDNFEYCIIRIKPPTDNSINIRRAIICNMLRAAGYGFLSTRGLSDFPHHSDHEDHGDALLVPNIPFDLAIKIAKLLGENSLIYNDTLKSNVLREHDLFYSGPEVSRFGKDLICQKIEDKHISQVTTIHHHRKIDGGKWQYDITRGDTYKLAMILEKNGSLLQSNQESDIYKSFIDEQSPRGMCFYIYTKYIKYMPGISYLKIDDFGDVGIAAALDAYWPLT